MKRIIATLAAAASLLFVSLPQVAHADPLIDGSVSSQDDLRVLNAVSIAYAYAIDSNNDYPFAICGKMPEDMVYGIFDLEAEMTNKIRAYYADKPDTKSDLMIHIGVLRGEETKRRKSGDKTTCDDLANYLRVLGLSDEWVTVG